MIPKIIHYCWFGMGDLPDTYKRYIARWQEKMPDYKIIKWDETNCDVNCNEFVKKAYINRKYAFVSDYFRLVALYEFGGIYLDTDVDIISRFDNLLENKLVLGYIWNCLIGTAVMMSEQHNEIIKEIIEKYENNQVNYGEPNNHIITNTLLEKSWFKLNGRKIEYEGYVILKKEAFEIPGIIKKGYCVHKMDNSWHDTPHNSSFVKDMIPYRIRRHLGAVKALIISPYRNLYLETILHR
ncbi:glycosyltransferase family 32 protein [Agathobacter sp.]